MTTSPKLTAVFAPEGSEPMENAIEQMNVVLEDDRAVAGALMADHHLGYSMPIGGVVAYEDAISPTGVGFDIACGNKAVRTNLNIMDFDLVADSDNIEAGRRVINTFKPIMRQVQKDISFGMGRKNETPVDHELFEDELWPWIEDTFGKDRNGNTLKAKAEAQLGTVGGGNHYVDLLVDEGDGQIWVANHFGSRGLGHTLASGFMAKAAGLDFTDRIPESEEAVVFSTKEELGTYYVAAMNLAGRYAYAGRDYVADQVLRILGATPTFEVHNHHNFAWFENDHWYVRKGATPLTREPAFIGGSMGELSAIVRGKDHYHGDRDLVHDIGALGSAPHGAGRIMSRTQAAGKIRKMWYCGNRNCDFEPFRSTGNKMPAAYGYEGGKCPKCSIPLRKGRMRDITDAKIDWPAVRYSLEQQGITVLGGGADEAPGVYKNLPEVLAAHSNIEVLNWLRPIGVVMASPDEVDPYKD